MIFQVFNDLAKDPLADPSDTGNWTHQPSISIYSEKLDLQSELKALSDSLVIENGLTPLGPVLFGIFGIFTRLRDFHVNPVGTGVNYFGKWTWVIFSVSLFFVHGTHSPLGEWGSTHTVVILV